MHRVSTAIFLTAFFIAASAAQINVTTYHNDNGRSGLNASETVLTPALLSAGKFGLLFTQPVDGQIYGQPLIASGVTVNGSRHDVVYVATENDSVYAFAARSNTGAGGGLLWHVSFINPAAGITPVASGDVSCGDLTPVIGITSTPVLDLTGKTIYVVAKTKENGTFYQRLHALDITSGAEKFGGPVVIQASVPGSGEGSVGGVLSFSAQQENQRAGLLLQGGAIYMAWAAHCDIDPYHGWVMAYDSQTLQQLGVWNSTPNGSRGGVWQSGAGLTGDGKTIFIVTGNGTADYVHDAGDSVIRLGLFRNTNQLLELDGFTAFNQADINDGDVDMGSGGLLLLPGLGASAPHPYLGVTAGKEGRIYLLDRSHLGGFNAVADQIVQELPAAVGGIFGIPAYWNNNVYFGGYNDSLKAFSFNAGGSGVLSTVPTSRTSQVFEYPGVTPSVSSSGTSNGIVWVLDAGAYASAGTGVLHAFDATNLTSELWNSGQRGTVDNPGPAVKFSAPTVANGFVYVGTSTQLAVYGQMAPPAATPATVGSSNPTPASAGGGRRRAEHSN